MKIKELYRKQIAVCMCACVRGEGRGVEREWMSECVSEWNLGWYWSENVIWVCELRDTVSLSDVYKSGSALPAKYLRPGISAVVDINQVSKAWFLHYIYRGHVLVVLYPWVAQVVFAVLHILHTVAYRVSFKMMENVCCAALCSYHLLAGFAASKLSKSWLCTVGYEFVYCPPHFSHSIYLAC